MNRSDASRASLVLAAALAAGCGAGGGGGGGGARASGGIGLPGATITTLGLEGTSTAPAATSVNGVADQDGAVDQRWRVELRVGSGALPIARAPDGTLACSLAIDGGDAVDVAIAP